LDGRRGAETGACLLLQSRQRKNHPGGYKTQGIGQQSEKPKREEGFIFIFVPFYSFFSVPPLFNSLAIQQN
jgi:hypothetical protein